MYKLIICLLFFIKLSDTENAENNFRIIGGNSVDIENVPYLMALYTYNTTHWELQCGVSIIDHTTGLTAAHCVDKIPEKYLRLLPGKTSIYITENFSNLLPIRRSIVHENFSTTIGDFDIAILKFNYLGYTPAIQPIQLIGHMKSLGAGIKVRVEGWGDTGKHQDPHRPISLQRIYVTTIPFNICKAIYGPDVTINMLCARARGKDSCQGDSGGPLMYNNVQVAVVHGGKGCANYMFPGIYTFLSQLRPWIDTHRN